MPIDWYLALRFLRDGRAESALIVAGVTVGVAVQVFISALITGLQADLIERTLGMQAHVVLSAEEERARSVMTSPAADFVERQTARSAQRKRGILEWQRVARIASEQEGVDVVSPRVLGSAIATRGQATVSVKAQGVEPDAFDAVVPIRAHLVAGRYSLGPSECVVGEVLAEDLGVRVGDLFRLERAGGGSHPCTVTGTFDLGGREANQSWVLLSLRTAQAFFSLPGQVTHLDLKVDSIFEAERLAEELASRTGVKAESWMQTNTQLLTALDSQRMSTILIQLFVMVAVAMGIASVLVVSVFQRSGQIGILRAIGTPRATILRLFLLQGAMMGTVGALLGSGLGTALALAFEWAMRDARGDAPFHVLLGARLYVTTVVVAVGTGLVAATLPARKAASLDPAVAIRRG